MHVQAERLADHSFLLRLFEIVVRGGAEVRDDEVEGRVEVIEPQTPTKKHEMGRADIASKQGGHGNREWDTAQKGLHDQKKQGQSRQGP